MYLGIDLGGTKISGILLDRAGGTRLHQRIATPRQEYAGTLEAINDLVADLIGKGEAQRLFTPDQARHLPVGIGMPGAIAPTTGLVQNANSTWLNDQPFARDLAATLRRPVRTSNDANCFALSEAVDGAGRAARRVFGVIIGTGCGGGIVENRQLLEGPRAIAGEWGHNPLPWMTPDEYPGPRCWCGRHGCMETFVSGPGMSADHARRTGVMLTAHQIARQASKGNQQAKRTLSHHADRLARGLAGIVNILDPNVIVLGGGLSNLAGLYDALPDLMAPHIFAADRRVTIRPPLHGDDSGVRGAAWLWAPAPSSRQS